MKLEMTQMFQFKIANLWRQKCGQTPLRVVRTAADGVARVAVVAAAACNEIIFSIMQFWTLVNTRLCGIRFLRFLPNAVLRLNKNN